MIDQIHHADCLALLPLLPSGSVDFIFGDLPYEATAQLWDRRLPMKPFWEEVGRVIRPDGVIALTASGLFTGLVMTSKPDWYRYRWCWNKGKASNFQLGRIRPMDDVEEVLIFSPAKSANGPKVVARYFPQKTPRDRPITTGGVTSNGGKTLNAHSMTEKRIYHDKCPTVTLHFHRDEGKRYHPNQKPVGLLEYLIKTYTLPGEVVLDPCLGGGTTAIAAINTGRRYIGIDVTEEHVLTARARLDCDHAAAHALARTICECGARLVPG